jgi:hypothetical protein
MVGVLCALARARAQPANADSPLHDLGGVAALQAMFEHDRDQTRIVLLLSPT